MEKEGKPARRFETDAVHAGAPRPGPEGSVVYPLYQGTVYSVPPGTPYSGIRYHRLSTTPSQTYLHERLAALEGAEAAIATASGMAAVTSSLLSVLRAGDHLIAADCGYGGTMSFLAETAPGLGWAHTLVDAQRPEMWKTALRPNTKLFLVETISNPLMRVPRLAEVVAFARENGLVTVIDNTFASPANFRPHEHGFDLVFHSATKYLNGHSDLVAGVVTGSAERLERVRRVVSHFGGSLDPHAGYLLARGLKTLALRVAACNANAGALARFLAAHPKVRAVSYPGLESHPDHAYAATMLRGFGGMLSFRLGGGPSAAERMLDALTIPYIAPSLGGVETLVTRPATTSHAGMPPDERERAGVSEDLVRVSCGVEAAEDLVADFARALEQA